MASSCVQGTRTYLVLGHAALDHFDKLATLREILGDFDGRVPRVQQGFALRQCKRAQHARHW